MLPSYIHFCSRKDSKLKNPTVDDLTYKRHATTRGFYDILHRTVNARTNKSKATKRERPVADDYPEEGRGNDWQDHHQAYKPSTALAEEVDPEQNLEQTATPPKPDQQIEQDSDGTASEPAASEEE